jgi:hypothetical protein
LPSLIELGEERAPESKPYAFALPLTEAPPARRRTRVLLRKILPARACAQHPEHALKAAAVVDRRSTTLRAALSFRKMRSDSLPLLVSQTFHAEA